MPFMKTTYLIFGLLLCALLAGANYRGYAVWTALLSRQWSPGQQSGLFHK